MSKTKLSDKQKAQFYYELSIFFNSGLDLKNALQLMILENSTSKQKTIYQNMYDSLLEGSSLASTLQNNSTFSDYESFNVKIGEETGNLAHICDGLSTYFQRKIKIKNQLIGAISYPLFILILTFGVLIFMMNFVVPMFSDIFLRFDSELPQITVFVINLSEWFRSSFQYIVIFFIIFSLILFFSSKNESFKKIVANIQLFIPIYGHIIKAIQINKYYQAMSLLLSSNITLIESVELSKNIISFYPLKKVLNEIEQDLLKGVPFNESLKKFSFIPERDILLFKIAEELNQLDSIFEKLTLQYQEKIDNQTQIAGKLIEPVLIVFIGTIVGFILISMYLPLFELSTSI